MPLYTVADSPDSLLYRGVEIMASSFTEARDKAEHMGVPCAKVTHDGDGIYFISDGSEIRDMPCEFVMEARVELGGGEGPVLL